MSHVNGGFRDPVHIDQGGFNISIAIEPRLQELGIQRLASENYILEYKTVLSGLRLGGSD